MVLVTEGKFWKGCNEDVDDRCEDDEKPGVELSLDEFWIDTHEVTVKQFAACVSAGKCNSGGVKNAYVIGRKHASHSRKCNWRHRGTLGKHPINCVNWNQAKAYCNWKGKRLPTEMEWEKAARGTDGRMYPWGNESADCTRAVMYDKKSKKRGCGKDKTWPVGSKDSTSPYGAYDMAGNVWEWTSSEESAHKWVIRGGSYANYPASQRTSVRDYDAATGRLLTGFRCVQ